MRRIPEITTNNQRRWRDDMTFARWLNGVIGFPGGAVESFSSNGRAFTSSSGTPDIRLYAPALMPVDQRVVMMFQLGGGGATTGTLVKLRDNANAVLCYVDVAQLFIFKGADGGGGALSSSAAISPTLSANTDYWLESSAVGNLITVSIYASDPDSVPTPTARATVNHTLTSTNATTMGDHKSGFMGLRAVPSTSDQVLIKQIRMQAL